MGLIVQIDDECIFFFRRITEEASTLEQDHQVLADVGNYFRSHGKQLGRLYHPNGNSGVHQIRVEVQNDWGKPGHYCGGDCQQQTRARNQ